LNFRLYAEVWMYHLQNKLLITQLHTSLSIHVNHTAFEFTATGLILTYFPRSVNNLNTASTRPRSVTLRSNCTDCMCVWQVCVCACMFVCMCVHVWCVYMNGSPTRSVTLTSTALQFHCTLSFCFTSVALLLSCFYFIALFLCMVHFLYSLPLQSIP